MHHGSPGPKTRLYVLCDMMISIPTSPFRSKNGLLVAAGSGIYTGTVV